MLEILLVRRFTGELAGLRLDVLRVTNHVRRRITFRSRPGARHSPRGLSDNPNRNNLLRILRLPGTQISFPAIQARVPAR